MSDDKNSYDVNSIPKLGETEKGHVNVAFENDVSPIPTTKEETRTNSLTTVTPAEEPERETWDNPIEFLLSCISMSVGLGNIWRFPFTAYKNGGGAFLIPYLVVLTFIGRPIYFLELALGQFSSYSQVKVWKLAPFFTGVGYGSMIGTICVVSYYASIMGLTLFYLFASFQTNLPWSICNPDWVALGVGSRINNLTGDMEQFLQCNDSDWESAYEIQSGNKSTISIPQLYFDFPALYSFVGQGNEVLKQKDQIDDGIGYPEWRLTLCLLLAWLVVWGSLVKGVQSSGKVAYFTALFPYVVLTIMLIRGVTLPNAWEGIKFFITPQWGEMLKADVWFNAVGQCFFSLSTGFGPLIMFGSYNSFSHNVYKDAWIVSFLDTFTSLFAGFTIFAVLGNLAGTLGVDVSEVAKAGPGLAFVSFAQGLSTFTWVPQLFAFLFYLMLFTLGVGSATSLTGGIISIICDQFPGTSRWVITTIVCCAGFLVGLIYVTPGGQFMLELVDHFGANFVIYVMATIEVMGVAWVYGLNNFLNDIEFMLGIRIGFYWKFCWGFFVPVGLTVILFYALATDQRLTYNGWNYPDSAIVSGWMIAAVALSILPLCAIQAMRAGKSHGLKKKFLESLKPAADWGPRRLKTKQEWQAFKSKQS